MDEEIMTEVIETTVTTTEYDAYDAERVLFGAPAVRDISVSTEVTNGYVLDVVTIAEDVVIQNPFDEYYLFGDNNNSWYLITGKHWDDEYTTLSGDLVVYHFYRDTYLPPEHPAHNSLTWFMEIDYDVDLFVVDNDDDFLVYSSAPNYPKLQGGVYDAQTYSFVFFGSLLFVSVFSVVLQQIIRRFG